MENKYLVKETKTLFDFYAGYQFKQVEIDAYYSLTSIMALRSIKNLSGGQKLLTGVGMNVKYNIIPSFIKNNKIDKYLAFSLKSKIGVYFIEKSDREVVISRTGMNYGLGLT